MPARPAVDDLDVARLTSETVALLREYLTFDTTNPPGDVSAAAAWVSDRMREGGLEPEVVGPSPNKPNVIATIDGGDEPLVLSHHSDVVAAPAERWTVPPFSGEERDGFVYGRGALDMKGFGALTLTCAKAVRELGLPLKRGLRLVVTADEEVGGIDGAKWLAANHPDRIRGAYMLTEGTFARTTPLGTWYPIEIAQKGVSTVKLTAHGQPGHASAPTEDNAVVRLAAAIARLGDYRSAPDGIELGRRFLSAFPPALLGLDGDLAALDAPRVEELIERIAAARKRTTMLRNTFTPTMFQAGVGQNVIPGTAEAYVDCRSLPGVTSADVLTELASVLADPSVDMELVKSSEGSASSPTTELFDALRETVLQERPDALVIPYLTSGGTDAKHMRPLGVVCYGLVPFELDEKETGRVHGIDERVSVANVELGLRILLGVVLRVCVG